MSRIRTIKPEFWGHPKTARLSRDARLLFLGLLNESDDHGRQLGSPKRIAGAVFPNDEDVSAKRVIAWITELECVGLVRRYNVDGVEYLLIVGFSEHQKVAHPTASRLPAPTWVNGSGKAHDDLTNNSGEDLESLNPYLGSRIVGSSFRSDPEDPGCAEPAESDDEEVVEEPPPPIDPVDIKIRAVLERCADVKIAQVAKPNNAVAYRRTVLANLELDNAEKLRAVITETHPNAPVDVLAGWVLGEANSLASYRVVAS